MAAVAWCTKAHRTSPEQIREYMCGNSLPLQAAYVGSSQPSMIAAPNDHS
jgi:hypothetical protein